MNNNFTFMFFFVRERKCYSIVQWRQIFIFPAFPFWTIFWYNLNSSIINKEDLNTFTSVDIQSKVLTYPDILPLSLCWWKVAEPVAPPSYNNADISLSTYFW